MTDITFYHVSLDADVILADAMNHALRLLAYCEPEAVVTFGYMLQEMNMLDQLTLCQSVIRELGA